MSSFNNNNTESFELLSSKLRHNVVSYILSPAFLVRALVVAAFVFAFSTGTYHTHRLVSFEYFRSCNANMFKTLFIKNSRYCEFMHSVILLMESKFIEVARMFVASIVK